MACRPPRSDYLRSGLPRNDREIRPFFNYFRSEGQRFSATQTVWRREWDSNATQSVVSRTYKDAGGTDCHAKDPLVTVNGLQLDSRFQDSQRYSATEDCLSRPIGKKPTSCVKSLGPEYHA